MTEHHTTSRPAGPAAKGFTLIEMLITVAVLAIILTSAVPSLRAFIARRHLDGASAQLQADLHFLRSSSVALNQVLRISVHSGSAGSCYLVHSGDADLCACTFSAGAEPVGHCEPGAELLRSQAWAGGPVAVRANVASMLVDPRHGTFSPTGSIEIQAGDGPVLRHVINLLGRLRLCAPGAAIAGVAAC
jgi:type IV fimbrial biogenesis protein FimT